jgi:methylenetetrahydrofolate reductase (NADPH)
MTSLSKTFVPPHILQTLEPIKENDEAVKDFGVQLAIDMCKQMLSAGIKGFHFYTLNLEKSVSRIVQGLGFVQTITRSLPWRPSTDSSRSKESVRPVFWLNRPKSYITRTDSWDDFPNGRWSDSRSPAFGDLSDYHLSYLHMPQVSSLSACIT